MPEQLSASHREQLAAVRPSQAKASMPVQACASRLRDVCADTIRTVSGNARAASIDMDIHEGHLSRQLKDGTLRIEQLEVLGPAFAAKFGQELVDKFGPLSDPKDAARRSLRQIEEQIHLLRQYIEDVA